MLLVFTKPGSEDVNEQERINKKILHQQRAKIIAGHSGGQSRPENFQLSLMNLDRLNKPLVSSQGVISPHGNDSNQSLDRSDSLALASWGQSSKNKEQKRQPSHAPMCCKSLGAKFREMHAIETIEEPAEFLIKSHKLSF